MASRAVHLSPLTKAATQMSSSPNKSDPDSSEDEQTVLQGLAARQHAVYGIDMLVLQVLRVLKQDGSQFYLAANLAGVGSFGHLLIANLTETGMSQVFLVHICPQNNIPVSLTTLRSACHAYLKLKRTLPQREDLHFLSTSLKDFRFVIYSTAEVGEDFPTLRYADEDSESITVLNTSSSQQPYYCEISSCPEDFVSDPELYSELKVVVFVNQANMDQLEKCLLAEIESLQLSRSAYARHLMLLRLKDQVRGWWKEKDQYLTGDDARQLVDDAWRYTIMTFAKNADEVCRRETNLLQDTLESCLTCKQNIVIIECSPGSEALVVLLLWKILGEKLLMVKLSNLRWNLDEILAAWSETLLILEEEQNNTTCNLKGTLCEEVKRAAVGSNRCLVILSSLISCKFSREIMANLTDENCYICHVYKRLDFEKHMEHVERELFQKVNDNICSMLEQQSLHFLQKIQTIMKEFNNAVPFEGSGEENLNVVATKEQLLKEMFMLMKQRAENKLQGKLRDEAITVLTELGSHLFQLGLPVQPGDTHHLTFHKPLRSDGYGAKLAAMIFLRCTARQQSFQLGANMSAAGRFGDLVVRVFNDGEEDVLDRTYLIQLRYHIDGIRLHRSAEDLQRIYNSYCTLKENWANCKDLQACGEFSDCILVVYTDSALDIRSYHNLDEKFSLLNTCGTCFAITEETFPDVYQEWKQHKEFLAQLCFLTEQAELGHFSKLLEHEVGVLLCTSATKSQEIVSQLETSFCNWWLLSNKFIVPNELFWSKITKLLLLNLSLSGNKLLEKLQRVTFKNQYLGVLKKILAKPFKCLHITTKSPLLSTMKVLQLLSGTSYVLLTSDSLLSQSEQVYALWVLSAGGYRHVVLMLLGPAEVDNEAIQLIKMKGIPKDGRLIVVSCGPILHKLDSTIQHEDCTKMLYLDESSATKVISSRIYFQGKEAILGEVLKFSKFPKEKLGEEILQEILSDKEIHIGAPLPASMEASYYIPRSLGATRDGIAHTELVTDVWKYPKKWVAILGEVGSGKTTFLIEFANTIQKISPYTWVVITTFADFINAPNPRDIILQKVGAYDGRLSAMLLSHELQSRGNIALLIDGLDEVEPHHIDEGLQALKLLKKQVVLAKVIILARPALKNKLGKVVSARSLRLLPFNAEEQKLFLVNFWQTQSRETASPDILNNLADTLLELLHKYIPDPQNYLTGTPFFMHILADIYKQKVNHPPTILDVFQLCKTFLNRRLEVFIQKKTCRDVSSLMFRAEKLHTHYALKEITNLPQVKYIPDILQRKFLQTVRNGSDIFGILFERQGHIGFIHVAFKEYYAGIWFGSQFDGFRTFLESQMFAENFQGIRTMMDRFLCQEFELHTAVMLGDTALVESLSLYNINAQDWGGRTALHLARNKDVAQILLQNGATNDLQDNVMNWTPSQYLNCINYG